MPSTSFHIRPVRSAADLLATKQLFEAYAFSLGIDLSFQEFAEEMAALPDKYVAPAGELLLARDLQNEPLGCVALRPMPRDGCCEMKRLYVLPQARGMGLGKALVNAVLQEARRIGYREMRLDTLSTMVEAIRLYRRAGFMPIPPYYDTPLEGTLFFGLSLTR